MAGWGKTLRGSMMPVFVALTAVLLAICLLIGQTVVAQQEARNRAMNEGNTLLAFHAVLLTMLDAETSQRGYALTGDGDYLGPYMSAKRRLEPALAALRRAAASDPQTSDRITWIASLTEAKFDEMDRTVTLTRTGMQAQAQMIIESDIGRQQMDAIRVAIAGETARRAELRREGFASAATLERRLIPLIAVLGLAILGLLAAALRTERNRASAAAEARQADALREANDRAQLLARELNHRVKNLFSVILSIVTLSGRKEGSSREVVESIRARIHALSLAHGTSQGDGATASAQLGAIVAGIMEPYASGGGTNVSIGGPDVRLPTRMVTPLGMIVHELATNAVKHGALSNDGGSVNIDWQVGPGEDSAQMLALSWTETGGPPLTFYDGTPAINGFGSQMMTLAANQLGGTLEREWPDTGAIVRLRFSLPPSD